MSLIYSISRSRIFSPGHVVNDEAIMHEVVKALRAMGHRVVRIAESKITKSILGEQKLDAVLSMARSESALQVLQTIEKQKTTLFVNPSSSVEACQRTAMTRQLLKAKAPTSPSIILQLDKPITIPLEWPEAAGLPDYPLWVKRGEGWVQEKNDVIFCQTHADVLQALEQLTQRGAHTAVVSKHLPGDLVKFYGVRGTDFFHWLYPDVHSGKFGLETINGPQQHISFDAQALHHAATKVAKAVGLCVYGGDAIIAPDGTFRFIDINDWPSFSPCRQEAVTAIAELVHRHLKKNHITYKHKDIKP